jgi:hypothetical protein
MLIILNIEDFFDGSSLTELSKSTHTVHITAQVLLGGYLSSFILSANNKTDQYSFIDLFVQIHLFV